MDRHDLIALFGTDRMDPAPERVAAGPLAADIADGGIVRIAWHGAEVLRGIAYPVRDGNWFTHADTTLATGVERTADTATYRRSFTTVAGAISGTFTCRLRARGWLRAHVAFRAERDVTVNRAGFVVLHPIADEAGAVLTVTHSDGSDRQTRLPRMISPAQPVKDIRALAYTVPAGAVRIGFSGDIFEMEDQRNWTDASFKTYCRPLALPFPYDIPAGTAWEQEVVLEVAGAAAAARDISAEVAVSLGPPGNARLPTPGLAHEDDWGDAPLAAPEGSLLVLRTDLRAAGAAERAADLIAAAPVPTELEAILPDEEPAAQAVDRLSKVLGRSRVQPASLTVLPAAYLASHQPEGPWPGGLDPVAAHAIAMARFPGASIGTGVFTNFTELNRLPRRVAAPDFVTYGTTAIVHAADDRSVMQTLEAMPQIHASAAALYEGAPIRLGLVAIGARSNPYGSGCAPNPALVRKAGAMVDPRQSALFAAAFMVGAMAATEGLPVERIVLGALSGPFALVNADGSPRPAWHVFRALAKLSGAVRRPVKAPAGLTGVAATAKDGTTLLILANTTPDTRNVKLPASATGAVLDHHMVRAGLDPDSMPPLIGPEVMLPPYALLLARLPSEA